MRRKDRKLGEPFMRLGVSSEAFKDLAERVDVGRGFYMATVFHLFRCGVSLGAIIKRIRRRNTRREPKIDQEHMPLAIDQHVARRKISMNDPPFVRIPERLCNRCPHEHNLRKRKGGPAPELVEALPVDVFHRDKIGTALHSEFEDADNVRMI